MTIWLWVVPMLLVAVGFICFRLWVPEGSDESDGGSGEQVNRLLYRQHIAELAGQYGKGEDGNNKTDKQALQVEALRQLLIDEQSSGDQWGRESQTEGRSGRVLLGAVAVLLCALAVMLYQRLGAMPDLQISNLLTSSETDDSLELREALVDRLAQRQDNFFYWLILARMELGLENSAEAVVAYRRARDLSPKDGAVVAELAQALFIAADQQINDEIESLIAEALSFDRNNLMALELAGISAFANKDYRKAGIFWQRALKFVNNDSTRAKALQLGLARAQGLAKDSPKRADDEPAAKTLLTLRIEPGEIVKQASTINGANTVYIYVREWQGMAMPLVAQRYTVSDLPLEVQFSDAMSLSADRKLSESASLEIIVRISSGGTRQARPGDFEGRVGPVSLDEQDYFTVIINKRLL